MFNKFISIKNLGRFRDAKAQGQVGFEKLTLIWGTNGWGKSTLVSVFQSLRDNNVAVINGRRTLGGKGLPELGILLNGSTIEFKNSKWSASHPDIEIFDSRFVHDNVYAGECVDQQHRRKFCGLVLGAKGTALLEAVNDLDEANREAARTERATSSTLQAHVPNGMTAQTFLNLKKPDHIDALITAKEAEVAALSNASDIAAKPLLATVTLPGVPETFAPLLGKELEDISQEAADRVKEHIQARTNGEGEEWVEHGMKYLSDSRCPFCDQSVDGLVLIDAYRGYFGQAYQELSGGLVALEESLLHMADEAALLKVRQVVETNVSHAEFWKKFVTLDLPTADLFAFEDKLLALWSAADACVQAKRKAPLVSIQPSAAFVNAAAQYATVTAGFELYNASIETNNLIIVDTKAATKAGDLKRAKQELANLQAMKKRHFDPDAAKACDDYREAVSQKSKLEADKKEANEDLRKYSDTIFAKYQGAINDLLENKFNAGFRIAAAKGTFPAGKASASYQIEINGVPVDLGDSDTPLDSPSFRNTLSAGDRTTLALALFLAVLSEDTRIKEKTIVFDDPFTSQDAFRRTVTKELICGVYKKAKQVVVLSHDPHFLALVAEGVVTPNDLQSLQISVGGPSGSTLLNLDLTTVTANAYVQHYRVVEEFYINQGGDTLRCAQAIRPMLEEYLALKFPGEFKGTWLGDYIEEIANSTPGTVLHYAHHHVSELRAINEYAKKYQHKQNPSAPALAVDPDELALFCKRAIKVISS